MTFKKDTDDIREAASLRVINRLEEKGAKVVAYDPMGGPNAVRVLDGNIHSAEDSKAALKEASCCIVMTEWDEFKKLGASDFKKYMKTPNIVDARRVYSPERFKDVNFVAVGVGPSPRPTRNPNELLRPALSAFQ